MNRVLQNLLALICLSMTLIFGACTLLLKTDELIVPCAEEDDCDDGFVCSGQSCLPAEDGDVDDEEEEEEEEEEDEEEA